MKQKKKLLYFKNLSQINGIKLVRKRHRNIHWMTSILLDKEIGLNRDKFSDDLRKLNIDTRPVFPSISQYPIWVKNTEKIKTQKL